jgi:hypothetical protein
MAVPAPSPTFPASSRPLLTRPLLFLWPGPVPCIANSSQRIRFHPSSFIPLEPGSSPRHRCSTPSSLLSAGKSHCIPIASLLIHIQSLMHACPSPAGTAGAICRTLHVFLYLCGWSGNFSLFLFLWRQQAYLAPATREVFFYVLGIPTRRGHTCSQLPGGFWL